MRPELVEGRLGFDRRRPELVEGLSPHDRKRKDDDDVDTFRIY